MSAWLERVLALPGTVVYALVGVLVFAEDALFIGFVMPGETAAILGGVAASLGHVSPVGIAAVVISAAILGDTVSYAIGRRLGPGLLRTRALCRRQARLQRAQEQLARRGGGAVFLGRFVVFLHSVMPALAGAAHMPYARFLAYNAPGGVLWGVGTVLLGYLAGASYTAIGKIAGRTAAMVVAAIAVTALIIWKVRKVRRELREEAAQGRNRDER